MSTGFTSNFNDSGYVTPSGAYNPNNDEQSQQNIPSSDIYVTTQQVGVYMLNGTFNGGCVVYPIFCSMDNMSNYGIGQAIDDAWLVYPGYGFRLYQGTGYSSTTSHTYINQSKIPYLFYNPGGGFNSSGSDSPIKTSSGSDYGSNTTRSVIIYFRGSAISVKGLSGTTTIPS